MKLNLFSLSDAQIAVLKYALDAYEDNVDGDRTASFLNAFYDLKSDADDEYRTRSLEWKVFWLHEP